MKYLGYVGLPPKYLCKFDGTRWLVLDVNFTIAQG